MNLFAIFEISFAAWLLAAFVRFVWVREFPPAQAHPTPPAEHPSQEGTVEEAPIPDVQLPALPELLAEAEALTARTVPAVAQAAAAPTATLTIKEEATDLSSLKVAALRRLCKEAGIRSLNAHGRGKHMSKKEMVAALS
jgi:hypothetical protein